VYVVNSPYFQIGYIADKDAQAIDFQNGLPVVWLEDGINSNVTYSKADNACQSRVKIYRRSNTESVYYEHWYIPEIDMLEHMKEVSRADNHDLATLTYYWSSTGTDTHKKIFKDVQGVSSIEERAITDSYRYIPIHKIGPKGPLEQDYNH